MPKVTFYPDEKSIQVAVDTTILQAARLAGVVVESPCNGIGTCGKCKVKVDVEALKNIFQEGECRLSADERRKGYVLACHTKVKGDISVEISDRKHDKTLKILNQGKSFDIELDSIVKKKFYADENITRIFVRNEVLTTEEGNTEDKNYGVIVDIGTTTLVASLVDIGTGEELEVESALNPQAVHAQDVLSRIKFASEEVGLEKMHSELINEINRMIGELTGNSGISRDNIYEAVFSGNTCMLHLSANIDPRSLGKYPYTPQIYGGCHLIAARHNINISEYGIVYLPPIISSYVGADITSGILASQLHSRKGTTLFVDIGTNGEMVIGLDGELSATSTAAGPAFEGMNITHGMRAGRGAIEFFNIEENGSITVKVIGGCEATGICGSGLLDIAGELAAFGVINVNGKFVEVESGDILPALKERLVKQDGKTVFNVTENVHISQKDIRQVQLAKGAVRAGIEFLLDSKGIKASEVDRVLIAGSFGYHLRAKSLINIGLLPEEFQGRIEFIGNTSKSGGQAFLLNKAYRLEMEELVKDIEVIELANYKDFDKVFVKCLSF